MAPPSRLPASGLGDAPAAPGDPLSAFRALLRDPYNYDFFQAVRLLGRLRSDRQRVGHDGPPWRESARFRGRPTLNFPASAIHDLTLVHGEASALITVNFFGLTGPNGVLPLHYTEALLRAERERRDREKTALREWLALFEHRLLSLFYRAWEKYRFYIPFERSGGLGESEGEGETQRDDNDAFTRTAFSFIGLGERGLRRRLTVVIPARSASQEPRCLARIDDLALLYFSGLLRQRPRSAAGLEALVAGYFQLPVEILQFQGQWLYLHETDRSRAGEAGANNMMGTNLVAGARVWDVANKFRLRIGPIDYATFKRFLPDPAPVPERKAFFLLVHLVRLYLGSELDFDVQLVLRAAEVPACQLSATPDEGAYLGWNTWVGSQPFTHDALDAVFAGEWTPLRV